MKLYIIYVLDRVFCGCDEKHFKKMLKKAKEINDTEYGYDSRTPVYKKIELNKIIDDSY